jgi:hypothetical protein
MPGKPYQSKLNPYRKEIAELRKGWPPTPYKEIARILNERHGLDVSPNSIWSFVKTRALNPYPKYYTLPEEPTAPGPAAVTPPPPRAKTFRDPAQDHELVERAKAQFEKEKAQPDTSQGSEWDAIAEDTKPL